MFGKRQGTRRLDVRVAAVGVPLVAAFLMMVGVSSATTTLCMPTTPNGNVTGPETVGGSNCQSGTDPVTVPESAELAVLDQIMPYIKFEAEGVANKPTIQFSGINVQIVNGEGKTATVNGEGNLVIGYNEKREGQEQTGSHDLILGELQTFTSFGGIVAGHKNSIRGTFASVTGGEANRATGGSASVSGGYGNEASGPEASVSGGTFAEANGSASSVSGGRKNTASNSDTWVGGGGVNSASGEFASVSGGAGNTASAIDSSVSGGVKNTASGQTTSISGGDKNTAIGVYSWIGGGFENLTEASGRWSSIYGGKKLIASKEYEAIP